MTTQRAAILCLLSIVAAPSVASARAVRLALVVGQNAGVAPDQPLDYAERDASRVADVLRELGQFDEVRLRTGVDARALGAALDEMKEVIARRRAQGDEVVFLFFFSGHGDERDLHLGGSVFSTDELQTRLSNIGAKLRVAIVDACESGALTRAKGVVVRGPVEIALRDELDSSGQAILASTSQGESAQESEALQGSFFTVYLVGGLRGAADANADGVVTLQEAYAYAYERTVRSTTLSAAGIQHPSYALRMQGTHDLPLSWPIRSAAFLRFHARTPGSFVVFSDNEDKVIAEVAARAGDTRRLGLPEGAYVVKKRSARELLVARVRIRRGEDAVLDESEMQGVPYAVLAQKGERPPSWLVLAAAASSPARFATALAGLTIGGLFSLGRVGLWPSLDLRMGAATAEATASSAHPVMLVLRPGFTAVGLSRFHRWQLFYGAKAAVPIFLALAGTRLLNDQVGADVDAVFGTAVWLGERAGLLSFVEAGVDMTWPGGSWLVRPDVSLGVGGWVRF